MDSSQENNKKLALEFLQMVIAGNIDEAYEKYVDANGKHHNVYYPGDFASLKEGMKENHANFPNKEFQVKNSLAEGDMVVTHSHLAFQKGAIGMVVVHIFRFENGKIVELWDCGQQIPEDSPNQSAF